MSDCIPAGWTRAASDLLAEVVMAATNHRGPFMIVEGPSDWRFFEPRVETAVYIVQAGGRDTCVSLVKALNEEPRVFTYVGVVDEDYDWLTPLQENNLVLTDTRDLESILMRSPALDAVVIELGDYDKVRAFVTASGATVRDALLTRAEFFGRLRASSFVAGTVSLDSIRPARFCRRDWSYDEDQCVDVCVAIGAADSSEALRTAISAVDAPSSWHLARGHDLIDILVGGLATVLGSRAPPTRHVEALLRQSIQQRDFEDTLLFNRISEWECHSQQRIWRRN